jgi:hypothetical protein
MSGSRDQNRIQPVDPDHATGAIRRLFVEIRAKFALVPNLFRVLANAPAALEGLMGLSAADARTDAILKLARSIVVQRGELSDADLGRARAGGLSDGEIVETVANVALNIFENYMSHVARLPIDFPQHEFRERSGQENESNGQGRKV